MHVIRRNIRAQAWQLVGAVLATLFIVIFAAEALSSARFLASSPVDGPMRPHRNGDGTLMRGEQHQRRSHNWSGYVVPNYQTGQTYTQAQGTWTVPAAVSSLPGGTNSWEYSSSWVGIGGECEDANCITSDSTLIQLGTEQDAFSELGLTNYFAWYEILPGSSVRIPNKVSPGDAISASIQCSASCVGGNQLWTLTMTDSTANWTWSTSVNYQSSLLSAELIEEATALCPSTGCVTQALADFGQVTFTGVAINGLPPVFSLSINGIQMGDGQGQTSNVSAPDAAGDFTVCWGAAGYSPCIQPGQSDAIVAAVLPESRSAKVGSAATVFATMVNAGTTTATGCGVSLGSNIPLTFSFQTTDPATNLPIGAVNTPASIPAGGSQSFVLSFSSATPLPQTNTGLLFGCNNADNAQVLSQLDTVLFSSTSAQVLDIVALSATARNDGILHIPGNGGSAAFAVATINLGSATDGLIVPKAPASLPLTLTICQTNPVTGQCLQPPTASVSATFLANATPTFAIFAQATGPIAFIPQTNRITVQILAVGVAGETSVAVETQ